MADQVSVMEVEHSGELALKVGQEMGWLWGVKGVETKHEILGWVEISSVDLWEVGVWLWPEIVVMVGSLMGLVATVYMWRWMRIRRKLQDVRVGEGYCKRCGYVLRVADGKRDAVVCAECGKEFKVEKVSVRKWWQVRWVCFAVALMVMFVCWGGAAVVGVSAWRAMKGYTQGIGYGEWRDGTWWDMSGGEVIDWVDLPSAKLYEWMMGWDEKWRVVGTQRSDGMHHELWGMWFDEVSGEVKKEVLAREYASEIYYEVIDGERRRFQLMRDSWDGLLPRFIAFDGGYLLTLGQRLYWYESSNGELEKIEMTKGDAVPKTNVMSTKMYDLGDGFVVVVGTINEKFSSDKAYDAVGKRVSTRFSRIVVVDVMRKKVVNEQNFIVRREDVNLDGAQCEPMRIGRDGELLYDGLCVSVSGGGEGFGDYSWGIVDADGVWHGLGLEKLRSVGFEKLPEKGWQQGCDFDFGEGEKVIDQRSADFTRSYLGELAAVVPKHGDITKMNLTAEQKEMRTRIARGVYNSFGGIAWQPGYDRQKWAMLAVVSKDDESVGRFVALELGELGRYQVNRGWLAADGNNKRVWVSRFGWDKAIGGSRDAEEGWVKVYEIGE
ncbi:hypothetical protein KS4_14760 [Poriferisphaera corsica]|uniref:Uncharacterized protein n=1 Tax=Poriferisphaera corsica TaxID=2528020 RepID=A0A517YT68_9BACT|nr:hypothetical protein [Poriferisphaera corsica]QDU33430.1 hypothetical protein KS4_14760 [Poriferisphaera corsica]